MNPATQRPLRVGVVDLGSNALRTAIVEWDGEGGLRTLEARRAPLRLGADVFRSGRVPEHAIAALLDELGVFRRSCAVHGVTAVGAIATAAMREAENRDAVRARVRAATGIELRVIDGATEAALLLAAVRSRLPLDEGRSLLVDLGGGSVELVLVQDGRQVLAASLPLGALRMLRALGAERSTALGSSFVARIEAEAEAVLGELDPRFGAVPVDRYVATGGNAESSADQLGKDGQRRTVDGVELVELDRLRQLAMRLAALDPDARARAFDLRPDRADTIVPAAIVLGRIGRRCGATAMLVPRVGIRDGLAVDLLEELAAGDRPPAP